MKLRFFRSSDWKTLSNTFFRSVSNKFCMHSIFSKLDADIRVICNLKYEQATFFMFFPRTPRQQTINWRHQYRNVSKKWHVKNQCHSELICHYHNYQFGTLSSYSTICISWTTGYFTNGNNCLFDKSWHVFTFCKWHIRFKCVRHSCRCLRVKFL